MPDDSTADRIQNNIPHKLQQIALFVNENGLEPSLKDVPNPIMPTIEALGVHPVQMSHPTGQIGIGSLDEQMVVVLHQAVGVTSPVESSNDVPENLQKGEPILVVEKDRLSRIPASRDVIHRARIL